MLRANFAARLADTQGAGSDTTSKVAGTIIVTGAHPLTSTSAHHQRWHISNASPPPSQSTTS